MTGQYYYPTEPCIQPSGPHTSITLIPRTDGYGETSEVSRPLKEGEVVRRRLLVLVQEDKA